MHQRAITEDQFFEEFLSDLAVPADTTEAGGVVAIVGEHPEFGAFAAVLDAEAGVILRTQAPLCGRLFGMGAAAAAL